MSGYFLNSKRDSEGWRETGLDYDLLSYRLTNLSCGSVYSFSLVCHNIAGDTTTINSLWTASAPKLMIPT